MQGTLVLIFVFVHLRKKAKMTGSAFLPQALNDISYFQNLVLLE